MNSLTAAGGSKSLTAVGDSKSLIVENEKSLYHYWGLKILGNLWGLTRILTTSARNWESFMTFLGNKESSDDLYWGIKTWEASNLEKWEQESSFYWEITLWRECLSCWRIFRKLGLYANLLGNQRKLDNIPPGLRFEVLDYFEERNFIFAGDL